MENYKKENKSGIAWELVLPVGEDAAISAAELCGRLGLTDSRALRYEVMAARLSGVPVFSCANGYFLGDKEKPEQIEHCINTLRKRAFSSLKQAAVLTRWKNGGAEFVQMSIDEFLKEEEARAIS